MKFPIIYYKALMERLNFLNNSNLHRPLGKRKMRRNYSMIQNLIKELKEIKEKYKLDENS